MSHLIYGSVCPGGRCVQCWRAFSPKLPEFAAILGSVDQNRRNPIQLQALTSFSRRSSGTHPNKRHYSKNNLTKAGAEKIKDLLKLYPDFKRDCDTWEMAGSKPGLFCYRCILLTQDQKPAGVGLGACDVSEKSGNMNNAIKIAKKRAFVDAILTTGSLSDFFTQDLEEGGIDEDRPMTAREMGDAKVSKFTA